MNILSTEEKSKLESLPVEQMITLYCHKKHHARYTLCKDCDELNRYSQIRITRCPFIKEKTLKEIIKEKGKADCSFFQLIYWSSIADKSAICMGIKMKIVFIILGFVFCAIGAVGVVLPILPTTPFLMLSTYCFARGSQRFHRWFVSTKLYQNHLDSFVREKAMTLKVKLCILIPATLMLTVGFLMMSNLYGRITIILLILLKYYYFFAKIQTISTSSPADTSPDSPLIDATQTDRL